MAGRAGGTRDTKGSAIGRVANFMNIADMDPSKLSDDAYMVLAASLGMKKKAVKEMLMDMMEHSEENEEIDVEQEQHSDVT